MDVGRFSSMGCEVVLGGTAPREARAIAELFEGRDARFSRFRPDSELNRVNASRQPVLIVSAEFARTVRAALRAARCTGGLVDPTVGSAVEAAGYTRDFDLLTPDPAPVGETRRCDWRRVVVSGRVLARPPGVRLDLNGVVKALAVDDALALIYGAGFVSAGGDVAARGRVVVGLPGGGTVSLEDGALATSGSSKRRWLRGGAVQHHLIDPRTGRPASVRWQAVTVAARHCLTADIAAKAAFLLDWDGPAWLDERGLPGRFIAHDGSIVVNVCWRRAIHAAEERSACT